MTTAKWYLLELNNADDLFLDEHFSLSTLLEQCGMRSKMTGSRWGVFAEEYKPTEQQTHDLNLILQQKMQELIGIGEALDEDERPDVSIRETFEILYRFMIRDWQEEEQNLIDFLQAIGKVEEAEPESHYFEQFEYRNESLFPLFHNIRQSNIALYTPNGVGESSFVLIGYGMRESNMHFTLKAFQYGMLETVVEQFRGKFELVSEENLLWKRLMSRLCGSGMYRPTNAHLIDHPVSRQFLKTSKDTQSPDRFQFVVQRLLGQGHLTEQEYFGENKVSEDGQITKFLMSYQKVPPQTNKELWVSGAGQVYRQLEKTDQKRVEFVKTQTIYAPHHDLLHYIRAYWHQNFVEEVLNQVQREWKQEQFQLQITDLFVDGQFDLLRYGPPTTGTRDFDAVLRVRHIETQEEYIIPVEMKASSSEYSSTKRATREKIDWHYVDIFKGFLMVAYCEADRERDDVQWEHNGLTKTKTIIPIVEHSHYELIRKLKVAIETLCSE